MLSSDVLVAMLRHSGPRLPKLVGCSSFPCMWRPRKVRCHSLHQMPWLLPQTWELHSKLARAHPVLSRRDLSDDAITFVEPMLNPPCKCWLACDASLHHMLSKLDRVGVVHAIYKQQNKVTPCCTRFFLWCDIRCSNPCPTGHVRLVLCKME
jgi:hypothetical protein